MKAVAATMTKIGALSALGLLCAQGSALAQDVQVIKQEFAKMEKPKNGVEWKASAAAGVTVSAGNSNVVNISGGAQASRNDGVNKVAIDLSGVYSSTTVQTLSPAATGMVGAPGMRMQAASSASDILSNQSTTAGYFMGKLRYDRFFTENNSAYLAGFGGLDLLAGKKATGGAELGYARQIAKTKRHDLSAELGVDYSYTAYVQPAAGEAFSSSVNLASGRLFLGYLLSLTENTSFNASFEALINFNPAAIGDRLNYNDPANAMLVNPFTGQLGGDARAGFGQATRWVGKTGFTSKIWKMISFRAQETLRYDNAPALSKIPFVQAQIGQPLTNNDRYLQKLDSLTELNVVITFL